MKEVIDAHDGKTLTVTKDSERITLTVTQECQDIIERCAAARADDILYGHRKIYNLRQVAELPFALVEILAAQGQDIMTDDDALRKVLNDPAFAAFRTSRGRV